jgi:hypothetical protein
VGGIEYSLSQQQAIFTVHGWLAADELARTVQRPGYLAHLLKMAEERLASGYEMYGSTMWAWSEAELAQNIDEELADAIVYTVARIHRGRGTILHDF